MTKYLLFILLMPICLIGKTLVYTTAFNRPDFVELQDRLFKKFLEDDYEFWVICDASTPEMREKMKETCDRLNLPFLQVPQEIHDRPYLRRTAGENWNNPNVRHCNSSQWAWDNYFSKHDGPVMIIDSDMFMIRPFSVEKTLENKHLAGVWAGTDDQATGETKMYLWLALILLNNPMLPERETICFNCGWLPNTPRSIVDSGGYTNLYLTKFKDTLNVEGLSYLQGYMFYCPYRYAPDSVQRVDIGNDEIARNLRARQFTEPEIRLALRRPYTIELIGGNHFLHYRAGTNYEGYSGEFLAQKETILNDFFEEILAE